MISAATSVAALLTAAPATPKLASPGLTPHNMPADAAAYYTDHFAQQLALHGLQVVTPSQIAAMLGMERQRQLSGCTDTGCMAELANALGAEAIVVGTIGLFGTVYQLDVKIVRASDGTGLSLYSSRVDGEAELLEACDKAAAHMAADILHKTAPLPPTAPPQVVAVSAPPAAVARPATMTVTAQGPAPWRKWALIPAIAGAALAVTGVALAVDSKAHYDALNNAPQGTSVALDPAAYAADGASEQTAAIALIVVGGLSLGTGAVMYLAGSSGGPVSASVAPLRGGAALCVGGVFR